MAKPGNLKHGWCGTPTYKSWSEMKYRCDNPGSHSEYYFDKKIKYCDRWNFFSHFLEDMGKRPPKTTLDRIDNKEGYFQKNCRWATAKQQGRNRTNNRLINGKTLSEWSELLGIKRSTLAQRYYVYGWSVDRVLSK